MRLYLEELKEFCPRLYGQLGLFTDVGAQILKGATDPDEQRKLFPAEFPNWGLTTYYYHWRPTVYEFVTALPVAVAAAERLGIDLAALYPPPERFR